MDDRIETRLSAPLLRPNRHIGMFWLEKLWLIIDWLQIYGLLWNAANSFPWPYLWIQWTSWTVWANLDYFSTTPDGALNGGSGNVAVSKWGQMPHYIYYAVGFSFPLFVALMYYLYLRRYYYRGYGVYREVERHLHLKYLLTASHLLYLPVSLAVFRLYYCDNADNSANGVNKLACDPSLDCLSTPHIIALSLGTLFMLPLVVGLPIITYQYISKKCVIYSEPQDHEKKLQVLEIMYALGLSETWIEGQMWMMSSFRRDSVYYRVEMLVMKLVLLGIFIYFRSDKVVQATLLWMVYTQYCMRYLFIKWPYRLNSSNLLLKVLLAVLLADVTFGLFNAMVSDAYACLILYGSWLICILYVDH